MLLVLAMCILISLDFPIYCAKVIKMDTKNLIEDYTEDSSNAATTTEPNPCNYRPPKMPNFSAPGRRISQVKCYEYIWDIKAREDKIAMNAACTAYQLEQGTKFVEVNNATIGGRDTLPGEFPHMGAIGWKSRFGGWIFKCGGSLISSKFILTAAHCSEASIADTSINDPFPKIVRLGSKNILDVDKYGVVRRHQDAEIASIIRHPLYRPPRKYYDLALIELTEDVQFSVFVQPACLFTGKKSLVWQKATMAGWGLTDIESKTTSPELQVVVLDIIDSQQCDDLLSRTCNRNWCGLQDSQICAGKMEGGVDACQGDSGGSLQVSIPLPQKERCYDFCRRMYQIIGVTSFGVGCALPNLPGVYSRVSSFVDWIEAVVWE